MAKRKKDRSIDTKALLETYGERKAYEWFMRAEDARYWKMTCELVSNVQKRMTILAATSMAFSVGTVIMVIFALLRKCR